MYDAKKSGRYLYRTPAYAWNIRDKSKNKKEIRVRNGNGKFILLFLLPSQWQI